MSEPVSEDARYLMIVRQGQPEVYLALKERLEDPGQVQVVWDRRAGDRRVRERRTDPIRAASTDRRDSDRRRTGRIAGAIAFLLARPPEPPSESPPAP